MKSGERINNKWIIGDKYGMGGQGTVYKVSNQNEPEKKYVLKFLNKQKDMERRKRKYNEVKNVKQLDNIHLMRIVDSNADKYEDEAEKLYYVAEFVEGVSLEEYVKENSTDFNTALNFFKELLMLLEYCHSNNIIHRDIKPDNIILKDSELMKFVLIDFGLSFNLEEQDTSTKTNQQLGNRFLILPELVSESSEQKRLPQSDITQAAGVFLYTLTGCIPNTLSDGMGLQPHQRESAQNILRNKIEGENEWENMNFILSKCFDPRVDKRYSDEKELLRDIKYIHERRVTDTGGNLMVTNGEILTSPNRSSADVLFPDLMNNLNPNLEYFNPNGMELPLETDVIQLIPYGKALPERTRKKIVKYYSEGDFSGAAERVWTRAMQIMRKRILSLGEEFVADMVEASDMDYVRNLPYYKVIELASELGFIDQKGKRNLLRANEDYNYYTSCDSNELEEMPKDESNIIIKHCIKYILYTESATFDLEFNGFRGKLKTCRWHDINEDYKVMFESCPYFYLKTTVRSLLNLFSETEDVEFDNVSSNMNDFFPMVWKRLKSDERRALADAFVEHGRSKDDKRVEVLSKIMIAVHGYDYVNDNIRARKYIQVARELKDAHFSMNNFYNEPSKIKLLEDLGTVFPLLALKDCVTAILFVKLGNEYGVSWDAVSIADKLLARLTEMEWKTYLEQYFKEVVSLMESIDNCRRIRQNWKNIIVEHKLKELNITDSTAKRYVNI